MELGGGGRKKRGLFSIGCAFIVLSSVSAWYLIMSVFYNTVYNNICILFLILLNVKYKLKFSQFNAVKTSTYYL